MSTPEPELVERADVEFCYGHPQTPTKLRCTRCERPICGRCAIPASVGQHCPECVAEARRSAPKVRSALRAGAPVTMTILVINIAFFVGQIFTGGTNGLLTDRLLLVPQAIEQGQWYRLLTATVLHGGLIHIFFNSYVLLNLGPNLEQALGRARFALVYVASGLLGSAFSYALPPENASLGASGAIFGIAGALVVFLFRRRRSTFMGTYLRSIGTFIAINFVLGLVLWSYVDNFAHLGGLVGGALMGAGLDRREGPTPTGATVVTTGAVVALAVLLVVWRSGSGGLL